MTDQDMLKWAVGMAAKVPFFFLSLLLSTKLVPKSKVAQSRPPRSFKDPSLSTGLFFLDVLEAIRPGIVDPNLIIHVNESGDYEDRRANG